MFSENINNLTCCIYQNSSIQGTQIQIRKDQMEVSHAEKNMVEQSSTVPYSQSIICKEYLNHTLGLTLSTPGLVIRYLGLDLFDPRSSCLLSLYLGK